MKFFGLEKLSLVDYDSNIAATVFTGGCNFRCPFCHNGPLVLDVKNQSVISEDEILSYLKKRKGVLNALCITGGEPTMHKELPEFIKKVKDLGYKVKLDSNGTNPEMLSQLAEKSLIDYVAMDIKSDKKGYPVITDVPALDLSPIEESIAFLKSGKVDYEFRTTLIKEYHSKEVIENIAKWISGAEKYFFQCFKETENCISLGLNKVDEKIAKSFLEIVKPFVKRADLRGY